MLIMDGWVWNAIQEGFGRFLPRVMSPDAARHRASLNFTHSWLALMGHGGLCRWGGYGTLERGDGMHCMDPTNRGMRAHRIIPSVSMRLESGPRAESVGKTVITISTVTSAPSCSPSALPVHSISTPWRITM